MIPAQTLSSNIILPWIMENVNKLLGTNFNAILINKYSDGSKNLGPHSDDEKALDQSKRMVVGLAFGATRLFRITRKDTGEKVLDYEHKSGTLIVMDGDFQSEFKHAIPKQLRVKDSRTSITFRYHLR